MRGNRVPAPVGPPRSFTLFDLVEELIGVAFVVAGCYLGWAVQPHFLAMLAGGILGRTVFVAVLAVLRAIANRPRT